MLGLHATRLAYRTRRTTLHSSSLRICNTHRSPGRNFSLVSLTNEFFDIAIALPFPPSWPPYASTIILSTVLARLVFTTPFSIWAMRRQIRQETKVLPELRQMVPVVGKAVAAELKGQSFTAKPDRAELQKVFSSRHSFLMGKMATQLQQKYSCQPWGTMAIGIVPQLAVFMLMTRIFNLACLTPTPLDSESFMTLSTLIHPDATTTLPIALGFITLINLETAQWWMPPRTPLSSPSTTPNADAEPAKGPTRKEVQGRALSLIRPVLRALTIGRILWACLEPGAVVIYWTTSAVYGLVQTWSLNFVAHRAVTKAKMMKPLSDSS